MALTRQLMHASLMRIVHHMYACGCCEAVKYDGPWWVGIGTHPQPRQPLPLKVLPGLLQVRVLSWALLTWLSAEGPPACPGLPAPCPASGAAWCEHHPTPGIASDSIPQHKNIIKELHYQGQHKDNTTDNISIDSVLHTDR